jgi:hypothetical protein
VEKNRASTLHILGTMRFSSMSVELKGTSLIVNMTFRLIINVNVNC